LDPAAGEKFVNIILVANVGLKGLAGHDEEVGRIGFADGARRAPYVLAAPKNGTAAGMAMGALNRLSPRLGCRRSAPCMPDAAGMIEPPLLCLRKAVAPARYFVEMIAPATSKPSASDRAY
jgi:hypothetical protein